MTIQGVWVDEWQQFEESNVVKIKRRTHTDKARVYRPRRRTAGAIEQVAQVRAGRNKRINARRAKNRVARKSRRVNRRHKR